LQRLLVFVSPLTLLVASCGAGQPSDTDERASKIYSAAIVAVASDHYGDNKDAGPIFVASARKDKPISLGVQAGVVDELHNDATILFVDDPSEAIDEGDPTRPVVDDGVLLTLGAVPKRGNSVAMVARRYDRKGVVRVAHLELERHGSTWTSTIERAAGALDENQVSTRSTIR
jgi:hypothetical protein